MISEGSSFGAAKLHTDFLWEAIDLKRICIDFAKYCTDQAQGFIDFKKDSIDFCRTNQ